MTPQNLPPQLPPDPPRQTGPGKQPHSILENDPRPVAVPADSERIAPPPMPPRARIGASPDIHVVYPRALAVDHEAHRVSA
jgi:hypothetical protein